MIVEPGVPHADLDDATSVAMRNVRGEIRSPNETGALSQNLLEFRRHPSED